MTGKNEKPEGTLLNHEYDGIREYNHPAPFWWQSLFVASIVFGFGYVVYYHFMGGPLIDDEFRSAMSQIELKKRTDGATGGGSAGSSVLRAMLADGNALAAGKAIYGKNCVSCHGVDGGGSVGPNMTDDAWIHGDGSVVAIAEIVTKGVPEKGMVAWGPILKPDEIAKVSAYVRSLRGTHPATPKSAQGATQRAVKGE